MNNIVIAVLASLIVTFASCTSYASSTGENAAETTAEPREPEPTDKPAKRREGEGDTDTFRGGFIGGVGFPRPLAIEGMLEFDRFVAVGLEYSMLPATSFGAVEAHFWGIAADVRLFPFRGAFFLGLRAGRQFMSATGTVENASTVAGESQSVSADTWFLNPRMGVLYTWKSGFTLGIDAGIQLPVKTTRTSSLSAANASDLDSTIASVEDTLGAGVTPTIDLLRIGFLF